MYKSDIKILYFMHDTSMLKLKLNVDIGDMQAMKNLIEIFSDSEIQYNYINEDGTTVEYTSKDYSIVYTVTGGK